MRVVFLCLFASFVFASEIVIAAASNLTYVMPEIIKAFNKKYPNEKIRFITSSSGKLTAQILKKAPFDLFLSADMKYPKYLYSKGIGILPPKVYAKGKLILLSTKYNNLSIKNLAKFDSIAISKPQITPYGKAAVEVFKNAKIYNKIKSKLVYAPAVAAVISYVKNGVDAGIISKSLIFSKNIKQIGKFYYKDINSSLYSPLNQGALLLDKKAQDFYKFLFSKSAKNIFKKYGYDIND